MCAALLTVERSGEGLEFLNQVKFDHGRSSGFSPPLFKILLGKGIFTSEDMVMTGQEQVQRYLRE